MNAAVEFANPWFLTLLAVLVMLPVLLRRSLAGFSRAQRIVCTLVRALLLTLIILALAGMRALLPSSEISVILAVDGSASISPEAARTAREFAANALRSQHSGDTVGVVGFARDAHVWQAPREKATLGEWPAIADAKATDIGHALDFSSALFPADQSRRVVLLSDGNDTSSHALEAATRPSAAAWRAARLRRHAGGGGGAARAQTPDEKAAPDRYTGSPADGARRHP